MFFEAACKQYYSEKVGAPAKPIRLVVLLKIWLSNGRKIAITSTQAVSRFFNRPYLVCPQNQWHIESGLEKRGWD